MARRVIRRSASLEDAIDIAGYLGEVSARLAERFIDAVEALTADLPRFPFSGAQQEHRGPAFQGIHAKAVPGFPAHYVFYRVTDETIEVLRILHTARDLEGLFEG
jgi:toxin ParE1/3/4